MGKREIEHAMWFLLHSSAEYVGIYKKPDFDHYNKQSIEDFIILYKSIINSHICSICKSHSLEYIKKYPLEDYIKDTDSAAEYVYNHHNHVNFQFKQMKGLLIFHMFL